MALDTFTPTAFRLIAQGCEATLGKEMPNPNYTKGVAPILGNHRAFHTRGQRPMMVLGLDLCEPQGALAAC